MWKLFDYLNYNNMYFEIAQTAIINMVCFGNKTSVLNCSFSVLDQLYFDWWFFDRSLAVSCQGTSKSCLLL